jgi:SAM-dependent methyltransferase
VRRRRPGDGDDRGAAELSGDDQRQQRRTTFEAFPEAYDRARPTYPPAVFDDLAALARLGDGARVLEIGPGTGQATRALAERGFRMTAVELGAGLADLARRKLASFPQVEIVNADFETWEPDEAGFDAVVAFTAFHWIDPDLRYEKPARLLREGGALAIVATSHVLPDDGDPFFVEVEQDYAAVVPSEENVPLPDPSAVPDLGDEIEASGRFRTVGARRHLWDVTYTADEYIAVLDTYSGHQAFGDRTRERLNERIHRRISARPGGTVRKSYLATLNVARRR